jgi:AcrR family transcriptional regulator
MSRKPAPRASLDDPKSVRTRERILDSAAVVLSRNGYAGTRLTDVAAQAELQSPAIYYYFKSREELIEEVMWAGIAHMRAHVREVLDALPPGTAAMDKIMAAADAHLRYSLSISSYTTAAVRNSGQLPQHLRARHESERNKYGSMWRSLFRDAQQSGELRPELDLAATRMLVLGSLNWAAEWWNPRAGSLDVVVDTAQTIIRNGIGNPAPPTDGAAAKTPASATKRRPRAPRSEVPAAP